MVAGCVAGPRSHQEYLEQQSQRAAKRIWARIHERVALQAEIPFAAPLYRGGPARMLVITRTPYIVFYVIEGDVLKVEQIMHGAQNR